MSKPTEKFTWATDATFSSGPVTGDPTTDDPPGWPDVTQGNVPGEGIAAEFINRVFKLLGQYTGWVYDGSAAGAQTAHIVETAADGIATLYGLICTILRFSVGTIAGGADVTLSPANGQIRQHATPTAQRDHTMTDVPPGGIAASGSWMIVIRPATGAFPIILHRPGSAAAIVTLPASTWSMAFVYYDGSNWRLGFHVGGTIGADA